MIKLAFSWTLRAGLGSAPGFGFIPSFLEILLNGTIEGGCKEAFKGWEAASKRRSWDLLDQSISAEFVLLVLFVFIDHAGAAQLHLGAQCLHHRAPVRRWGRRWQLASHHWLQPPPAC